MKERTNEEELELFADLLEPAAEIFADPAVEDAFKSGRTVASAVKVAIKNHKSAVIEILARIDGIPVAEYKVSALTLPIKLASLLGSVPEITSLFTMRGQKIDGASSGSATESTEDGAN